jgi:hypothetical protein
VNPMNRGVFSGTCGFGGLFQDGIAGRSARLVNDSAKGKLSAIGGLFLTGIGSLWIGPGGRSSFGGP